MPFAVNDFSAGTAQTNLQQVREAQLMQQLNSTRGLTDNGKIEKSARDFESMLLGTWLQQAEQSFATIPGADDEDDAASRDQMMSLGVQNLAQALTASGGIGIAKMIARDLHQKADREIKPETIQNQSDQAVHTKL
jgi:Rod binding domain-containing protein